MHLSPTLTEKLKHVPMLEKSRWYEDS